MMKLLLSFLIATTLIGNSVGLYCPTGCTCFQRTVRCIQARLTTIPKIPVDTFILDLRFNQLREIPAKSFEGLKYVHTIFLTENQIAAIEEDSFIGLNSLKYLYLGNNHISKIAPKAFQKLTQLESLYLDKNDIWKFDAKTFSNLPQLSLLFLFNNKISGIPEGAFSNLPNLQRLRLDSNPIECDCGVYDFLQNHKTSRSRATVSLICETPTKYEGRSFASLRVDDFHCRKPEIMEEPHDLEVNDGDLIVMPCRIDGDPKPEIVWMQNTNEITVTNSNDKISPKYQILDSGSLQIIGANSNDMAIYECIGRNTIGEVRTRPIRLTMNAMHEQNVANQKQKEINFQIPKFVVKPLPEETVSTNEPLIMDCSAEGIPNPQIQWSFNGRQISQSTQLTRIHSNGTLVISRAALRNAGTYKCEASNNLGNVYTTVQVSVNELPEIILEPQSQSVKSGTTLILECDADGDPQPTLSWKHNGNPIDIQTTGNTTRTSQSEINNNRISLRNENTELEIVNVKESDSGQYTCVAENINGISETSADVIVEGARGPPRLVFEPYNIEALSDTTIELPCKGEGDPIPQVKWQRDGQQISQNKKYRISSTGSLYIRNLTVADGGRYECSIINSFGRATASGLVTVRNQEILAPGDRYVRIAFDEASREIDLAINSTVETLFNNRSTTVAPNPGDLLRIFRFPTGEARQLARAAEIYERTLVNIRRHVREGENLTVESSNYEHKELLSREHLHLVAELSGCMQHRQMPNCTDMCYHSKYRNIDGTCNNLNNPTWGASLTAFRRIKKPVYENKFSMPIGWTKDMMYNGFKKPSARMISNDLITTTEITPDDRITHMVMQWGQFLDHDLDHAIPSVSSESWDGIDCKKTCEYAPPCYPMDVPANDPRIKNRRCIDFVRSSAICGSGMTSVFFDSVQPREQINQLTSYIDASQVYGYSYEFSRELRNITTDDGLLRTGVHFPKQGDMLPFAAPQDGIDCRRNLDENKMNCFVAGDIRVNEQVGLLAMHTIWMREHNRIAIKFRELNPHWDGDTIYEESRKIIGAQMQHFTYKHWLPLILGEEGMQMLGQYEGYNPSVNPSIANEFATAALRFGHSLINPILHRLNSTFQAIPQGHLQLHKAFFAPWRLVYEGGVDPLMRGLFSVPAKLKTPAQNLNADLTEKLFQTAHAVALDLAAMNVQRGRDHGIPSYNEYRKFCNLTVAEKFDDLHNEITNIDIRNKLKDLYGHPDNIDIWVGGILEDQVAGGKVGPLFRCLLIEQFRRLRDGDRFYYESPSVFLPEQLQEIKQSNLGRVLCDNGDNITQVTDNVFMLPKIQGGYKNCIDIPGINLYYWQDCNSCNSLAPILTSYVPSTYPKRKKRSIAAAKNQQNLLHQDDDKIDDLTKEDDDGEHLDMNEERVSGLEEIISGFHKELKKLKKKLHKLEQCCSHSTGNNEDNDNDNRFVNKHHHCHDASGTKRLNNEIWVQDDCTKCECKHSEVTCIREKCGITTCPDNLQPMRNPGDCCPHCPAMTNPNA